jgi:electron transport complex protein RnfG
MQKIESTFKNMFFSLFFICAIASLALAGVYIITLEPITTAQKAKKEKAIKDVLPEFNRLQTDTVKLSGSDIPIIINFGYKDSVMVGAAVETYSTLGYSGPIRLMVGFLSDGKINKIEVLQQKETPGLGTKIAAPEFRKQFYGKSPDSFKLNVKKDGGEIDAITAATISSRAFCDAVQRGYVIFQKQGGSGK